jgi:hypothetical protein
MVEDLVLVIVLHHLTGACYVIVLMPSLYCLRLDMTPSLVRCLTKGKTLARLSFMCRGAFFMVVCLKPGWPG